jgi:hypothetical protein
MARIWLALLVSSSFAFAQPVVPPMTDTPSLPQVQAVLPNLFAMTPGVTVDVRADYSDFDQIDASVLNVLGHVQYLTPQGFGGYLRVPYGYVEESDIGIVLGGKGIGNVEVGGLILTDLAPETTLLGRVGVSIDTASEEDNFALLYSTILPRLVDVYSTGLQTTWARGEAQIRHVATPQFRVGGSIGADYPLAGDGADSDMFDVLVHGTLCAGFEQGHLGVGVSLVLLRPITDSDDENLKGVNFAVDYLVNPQARVYFTVGLSLEDEADGTSFGLGARSSFR